MPRPRKHAGDARHWRCAREDDDTVTLVCDETGERQVLRIPREVREVEVRRHIALLEARDRLYYPQS